MDTDDALTLSKHLCQAADIYKRYYERNTGELEPRTDFEYRRAAAFLSFLAAKTYPPVDIRKVELCISAGWMAVGVRAYSLGWKLVNLAWQPQAITVPPLILAELGALRHHLERMAMTHEWHDAPPNLINLLLEEPTE